MGPKCDAMQCIVNGKKHKIASFLAFRHPAGGGPDRQTDRHTHRRTHYYTATDAAGEVIKQLNGDIDL